MFRNKKFFSAFLILILAVVLAVSACAETTETTEPTVAPTAAPTAAPTTAPTTAPTAVPTAAPTTAPTAAPTAVPTPSPTLAPIPSPTPNPRLKDSALRGGLVISEIMSKNHASLMDEDGKRPDWIELHNTTPEAIDLRGFTVSDDADEDWVIPGGIVVPDGYFLIYADGKDRAGEPPHADFKLSAGETVVLRDADGRLIDCADCICDTADLSQMLEEDGEWAISAYPTPGYENTAEGYDAWQDTLVCNSPLIISEVMTYNTSLFPQNYIDYCDWIELKNVSDADVELSDYYLSDDDDDLTLFHLPQTTLRPGKAVIVLCTDETGKADKGYVQASFALNSDRERIYLSSDDALVDCAFLRDIPYGCSFGRESGKNGWFFFAVPQPVTDKTGGYRRVSRAPTTVCQDGIFNGVTAMNIELSANGDIYYTTDGSLPTVESEKYTRPFDVTRTCVVRAVAVEDGAMVSRPLTLSYILNENHTLPVVSLAADSPYQFTLMYNSKKKDVELPGNIAFYAGDEHFSVPCGIDMHGETSLNLRKKNMGIHFRGAYGQSMLDYDLFGGGVTSFGSLILRAGQDQSNSIIKNELGENLCLAYSDKVLAQRSRYCVLYVNGEYRGIYALMEKMNESHYATHRGVSKDSVTVVKAPVLTDSPFYREIVDFAKRNDLTQKENYDEFCRRMDIDSLIDWIIIEGFTANTDLNPGNARYAKSTEDDGKWRVMLFDLDSIFLSNMNCYKIVLGTTTAQYSSYIRQLIRNPEFKERFLTRAAEVLDGALSDESVLAEIDRLTQEIAPEVPRDFGSCGMDANEWLGSIRTVRSQITDWHWHTSCIRGICEYFGSSTAEYFTKEDTP